MRATGPIERFADEAGEFYFYDDGELYNDGGGALPSIKISGPSSGIGDYVGSRSGPSGARLGREEQRRRPRDPSVRASCSSPISRFGSDEDRTERDTAVAQEPRERGGVSSKRSARIEKDRGRRPRRTRWCSPGGETITSSRRTRQPGRRRRGGRRERQ